MRTFRFFIFAGISVMLFSCGQKKSSSNQEQQLTFTEISIDSLTLNPTVFEGDTVQFVANVDHVCKHTGRKLVVFGANPEQSIKVMATNAVPNFDPSLNGATVEVVGVVKGVASEQAESCETHSADSTVAITYTVDCLSVKVK